MRESKHKSYIEQMMIEFTKYDKKHHNMVVDLEKEVFSSVIKHTTSTNANKELHQDIKSFVVDIINATYSAIDKDENFPEERMLLELEIMNKLLVRNESDSINTQLITDLEKKISAQILIYFPDIYNFSANGFRLFDKTIKYQVNLFLRILKWKLK